MITAKRAKHAKRSPSFPDPGEAPGTFFALSAFSAVHIGPEGIHRRGRRARRGDSCAKAPRNCCGSPLCHALRSVTDGVMDGNT